MQVAGDVHVFTTCPLYRGADAGAYATQLCNIARWSDEAGCKGILIYTDNSVLDPWQMAHLVVQNTSALMPLVAVQPVYQHPYTVAKAVSTLSCVYGRRIAMNMVAGGFKNDLAALNDPTPHDRRYERLVEYTTIVQRLLEGSEPVTFEGEFYTVRNLRLAPALPRELFPLITISGSSAEGLAAAHSLGIVPVRYPEPAERCVVDPEDRERGCGIRVGIIAREDEDTAWQIAYDRFPPDRAGEIAHKLAMKISDSSWHRQLSELAARTAQSRSTYWMVPFEQYKTFCPYFVGNYSQVSSEIGKYVAAGFNLFILDAPVSEEELAHIQTVFSRVSTKKASA